MKAIESGFTFIEVMIAIMVVGIGVPSIMSLQSTLFRGTHRTHERLRHLAAFSSWRAGAVGLPLDVNTALGTVSLSVQDPVMQIAVQGERFGEHASFSGCVRQRFTVSWSDIFSQNSISFVSFRFLPELFVEGSGSSG